MVVRTEITLARPMIISARPKPAFPTTYPSLRKRIMPRMVRTLGVNTPENVPRVPVRGVMDNFWRLSFKGFSWVFSR
jgi:hypothetical protein